MILCSSITYLWLTGRGDAGVTSVRTNYDHGSQRPYEYDVVIVLDYLTYNIINGISTFMDIK